MHADLRVTKHERKTPSVRAFHDYTKGALDVVDLVSSRNPSKMKVKQRPVMSYLSY